MAKVGAKISLEALRVDFDPASRRIDDNERTTEC